MILSWYILAVARSLGEQYACNAIALFVNKSVALGHVRVTNAETRKVEAMPSFPILFPLVDMVLLLDGCSDI